MKGNALGQEELLRGWMGPVTRWLPHAALSLKSNSCWLADRQTPFPHMLK